MANPVVQLEFSDELGSLVIRMVGDDSTRAMSSLLSSNILRAALPYFDFVIMETYDGIPDAVVEDVGSGQVRLSHLGGSWSYAASSTSFAWDLTKVLLHHLALKSAMGGRVLFHAAAFEVKRKVVMVPGGSGAGKSVISCAFREDGGRVLASETACCTESEFVAGNALLTVRRAALERHAIRVSGCYGEASVGVIPLERTGRFQLSRVVFLRLTEPSYGVRIFRVSPEKTRWLLWQNCFPFLVGGFLCNAQRDPSTPVVKDEALTIAAKVIGSISCFPSGWMEGGAREIARAILQGQE